MATKTPTKRGRRTKLTPALQKSMCEALQMGATRRAACGLVGISETTFYRWMTAGAEAESGVQREFRAAIERAEARGELSFTSVLYDVAMNEEAREGDRVRAALGVLSKRYGWVDRTEVSGPGGSALEVKASIDVPPVDEGRTLIRGLRERLQSRA